MTPECFAEITDDLIVRPYSGRGTMRNKCVSITTRRSTHMLALLIERCATVEEAAALVSRCCIGGLADVAVLYWPSIPMADDGEEDE